MQQGYGCRPTVVSWNRADRVDRASLAQPLDHLLQLALLGRLKDLAGQQGGRRAHRDLTSVRWGGRRGKNGKMWRRCVLPDELRDGFVALTLGPPQGVAAVGGAQLGVGPGSQQGLHARLLPFASGHYQGSLPIPALQVRVGRVLQEETQDREAAVACSGHERGVADASLQVDACASLQQYPHHLHVAVGCGDVQQGCRCGRTVFHFSRAERVDRPSLAQPPNYLVQLTLLRHRSISSGMAAGGLNAGSPASGWAASEAATRCGGDGAACCRKNSAPGVSWPSSAHCWTVRPCTSTSWVAASASRSRACMHPNIIMWMGTGVDDVVHYNVQGSLVVTEKAIVKPFRCCFALSGGN
eukprot:scaffold118225_cov60-Phaeocystis_antarctica.AAC.3